MFDFANIRTEFSATAVLATYQVDDFTGTRYVFLHSVTASSTGSHGQAAVNRSDIIRALYVVLMWYNMKQPAAAAAAAASLRCLSPTSTAVGFFRYGE